MMIAFAPRTHLPALALAVVLGSAAAGPPAPHHTVVPADAVQWGAAPPSLPAGAQAAVLFGNPAQPGPFVLRLKFPAGYSVPPHRHSKDEPVTVVSGRLLIGAGSKLDRAATTALAPAGFVYLPAGMAHYAIADGETVVQINGVGPFDVTYLNPHDDPRKQ
jgi:quercetin dioxygenase-like cupin family protein